MDNNYIMALITGGVVSSIVTAAASLLGKWMDVKHDTEIHDLKKEVERLKRENKYLKREYMNEFKSKTKE